MMTADRAQVGRKMARGGILMVLLRLIGQSIGLVSTIILARLLVPEDFGLVALAMTLLGALEVTGRFGLDRALIRHQQAGRELYDTAWTLQLIRGVAMALILALTAGFWADFFDEDRLQNILYVFAVMALIKGFRNIGIVQFSRDLEFDPLFKLELRSQTGAAIASIVLALLWQSYWALILGVVVERTLLVALSYTAHPHRPRLSLEGSRYLIHFSKWVMANSIIVYLNRRSDVFILGKLASVDVVGHYSIAKQLSTLASNEIASPAARAFYSGFARTATDLERLRALYLSTLAVLLLVGLPLAVGIACVGDLVIRVLFGEQWLPAVPLLQILVISGIVGMTVSNTAGVLQALGRPELPAALAAARFAILVPLMFWGFSAAGPIGVAWAVAISAVVRLLLNAVVNSRLLGFSGARVASMTWRSVVSAGAMAGALMLVRRHLPDFGPELLPALAQLLTLIALGGAVYGVSCLSLWALSGLPHHAEWLVVSGLRHQLSRADSAA
jgi:lipopolysaccharide exporter